MKILFINAQDTKGGASIAPYRLSKALEKYYNTENYFIVGKKHSNDSNIFCTRKNDIRFFIELLTDKILNKLGLQYQYFPFSTRFIMKKAREINPDIISLHNTHEGYFKTAILKSLSKIAPIVWTLHDMWSFSANAVHTFGDESWKQLKSGKGEKKIYPHIGINTGKWLLRQKRRIYKKSDIRLITPSRWLYQLAGQSPVFANKQVFSIPHGIDLEVFNSKEKKCCRSLLDLHQDAKVVMFSSAGDLDICPWKGGKLLVDILKVINSKISHKIDLLIVGKGELKELLALKNLNVHKIGYVTSEKFMTILLSAADLFIYPTRADSFGLVLAESIACGTPAVTFDVGGCSDIIKDNISGVLIKPFDVETFTDKSLELLNNKEKLAALSASSREFAAAHFDLADIAKQHFELFTTIIKKRKYGEIN
jgi:glycosyltransferase involved in cell wall biosynthesis